MEKQQPMPDLGASVDWETFQRVWKRVMPDESKSPIELIPPPPPPKPGPKPQRPPQISQPPQQSRPPQPPAKPQMPMPEQPLEPMFRHLCRGIGIVAPTAGQHGQHSIYSVLLRQRQQALRRLQTLYFLETGKNYTCQPIREMRHGPMTRFLREQYRWEQEWARMCQRYGEQAQEIDAIQLFGELALQALERQQKIRQILEHGG